jgi:hypothetical protein
MRLDSRIARLENGRPPRNGPRPRDIVRAGKLLEAALRGAPLPADCGGISGETLRRAFRELTQSHSVVLTECGGRATRPCGTR